MKKRLFVLFSLVGALSSASSVGISNNNDFIPREDVPLHVDNVKNSQGNTKAVVLPKVKSIKDFPEYNEASPTGFNANPNLEGSILYNEENDLIYEYNGEKWISVFDYYRESKSPNMAHYTIADNIVKCEWPLIGSRKCDIEQTGGSKYTYILAPKVDDFRNFNSIPDAVDLSANGILSFKQGGVYNVSFKIPFYVEKVGGLLASQTNFELKVFYSNDGGVNWQEYHDVYKTNAKDSKEDIKSSALVTDGYNIAAKAGDAFKFIWTYDRESLLANKIIAGINEPFEGYIAEVTIERLKLK